MHTVIEILDELKKIASDICIEDIKRLCERILRAKTIFTVGRGRSGLISRMFAMRLMQMGINAYAVDEVVTPAITEKDILLICSGSGETASLRVMADKAKEKGAEVIVITANKDSYIKEKADDFIFIPGYTPKNLNNYHRSIQPMGSQFEQLLFLVLDSAVLLLKEELNITEEEMMSRHANLE